MNYGTFDLKIGFKCNNNCKHCVVADKRPCGELTLEEIMSIIDRIPQNIGAVVVTGGEPTISPYFVKILTKLKEKKFYVILQSNGTGFEDESLVEKTYKLIDNAHIAIHSSNAEVHDLIVGTSGMWEKTIKGFKNLLKKKELFVTTQTVLSKYNIETLYETYEFIQELHPGSMMSMTYPHLMGNAYSLREDVAFRYIDYKDIIQKCLKKFGSHLNTEAIPYCHLFPYENKVRFVTEERILDFYRNQGGYGVTRLGVDFSDGFESKDYNYLDTISRVKAPRCKECIFQDGCLGVWKEYIELFKNNLDLFPITKEKYLKGHSLLC